MLVRPAEESFEKGMQAFAEGRGREAMAFFEAAIELSRKYGKGKPQARYLSQYGLCLCVVTPNKHQAVEFCREAVTLEGYNPDLQWNLARAFLAADRRRDAYRALLRGLRLQPDHAGLISEIKRMGVRRRPVLPFLQRDHPLNVTFGRMRRVEKRVGRSRG